MFIYTLHISISLEISQNDGWLDFYRYPFIYCIDIPDFFLYIDIRQS